MAPSGPSTIATTDGNAVTPRDREHRYRRAREVLAEAGWLFDDFVNGEMRRVLTSDPDDMTAREVAYTRARVATELKTGLASLVDEYEADTQLHERREQLRESLYGRRT
jgi:hypothetical protein